MKKDAFQLQTITQKVFYDTWESKKVDFLEENEAVLQFFKPFVDTIPKLALGEYYWQIFDNAKPFPKIMMVGGSVEKLTPSNAENFLSVSIEDFFAFFYPEDLKQTMTFVAKVFEILFEIDVEKRHNFNFTIYTRVRNQEEKYHWNSLQYPALYFDKNGDLRYGMALYTNVNHLMKPDAEPMMTILDSSNKSNQVFTCYKPDAQIGVQKPYPTVTQREKEIIALLSQGKASKQISGILGIKKNTVDNHRQRLLKKFGVTSSAELVMKALVS